MTALRLILIPGLMCDAAAWAAQCAAPELRAFAPVVADHGMADSLQGMARRILAAHDGPLLVAGHSMGGRVALELARLAGARLRGVALLDTGYRALAPGEAGARETAGRMHLLELARREGVRAMAATWVQGMVHPKRLRDRALIDAVIDMFGRRTVEQFAVQQRALLQRPDATDVLRALDCPTLLLCGGEDSWAPPSQHAQMAALVRDATTVVVPDCGHMAPMERPQAVTAVLATWVGRCTAGPMA